MDEVDVPANLCHIVHCHQAHQCQRHYFLFHVRISFLDASEGVYMITSKQKRKTSLVKKKNFFMAFFFWRKVLPLQHPKRNEYAY